MNYPYEMAVFAERNRLQVFEAVVKALEVAADRSGITRKDIAQKTGRSPAQITNWLSGPSNWTLDSISDLLRAIEATMDYTVVFDAERKQQNIFHPDGEPCATGPGVNVHLSATTASWAQPLSPASSGVVMSVSGTNTIAKNAG